jgi:manganese/iron transport system permease protein
MRVGLCLSYAYHLAAGGLIVLVGTGVFVPCRLFAPRHGLIASGRRRLGYSEVVLQQ